uniref:S41 family peptidase n=1 Tax=Saccharicrinis aurantiacus TaxID=1849719 RepID=UPI00094FB5F6
AIIKTDRNTITMKKHLVLSFLILISSLSFGQTGLSKDDKIEDFEYLFQILKQNYPFFEAEKRMNGFSWLDKKKEYKERLTKTENDSLYYLEFKSIMEEMESGHTDFLPTAYKDYFLKGYKKMDSVRYKAWISELEKAGDKPIYWTKLIENKVGKKKSSNKEIGSKINYTDSIIDNQIALMNIKLFDFNAIDTDSLKIDSLLNEIMDKNISKLIINIQGNGGGSMKYWQKNIVSRLTQDTIINYTYPTIRKGKLNQSFYPDFFESAEILTKDYDERFVKIPAEALANEYYIKTWKHKILPINPVGFSGEIYLLVDEDVFSSSEAFAQFCKTSGWAKVVGERTGGDGIGADPGIVMLPKSGLLLRYPVIGGLNYDGSYNYEEKTVPDLVIEAETTKERLEKLIILIRDNQ